MHPDHPDRIRALKDELFALLGDECVACGFDDRRALQLDHVAGGGGEELKRSGNRRWLYRKAIRETLAGDETYQILCANCNWIKRFENEHERGRNGTRYKTRD